MHIYTAHLMWSNEDNGFIAVVPQLPGCSAFGKSMEKAVRELQYAIDAWIDAAKAAGKPVPAPIIMQPLPLNIVRTVISDQDLDGADTAGDGSRTID